MSLALHLTRRSGGVYYYRQRTPRQISSHYNNRKEICFSLNTKEPYEAKQLSYAYSLKYSQEFEGHMPIIPHKRKQDKEFWLFVLFEHV